LSQQVLELAVAIDDLADEPAFRHDTELEAPDFVEGAAHQTIAVEAAAHGRRHPV
jgi:hypothetical protein